MIRTAHTAQLGPAALAAARALVWDVFAADIDEADWEHALGGIHVLAYDGDDLVGHAAVVMRRLLHGGRALRCGYVEAVAVREDRRRRGHGRALMRAVEPVVRGGYDLGALGTSEMARSLYESLGWMPWRGPLRALTPAGVVDTPDEAGGVYVLRCAAPLDLDGELVADWRDGDVW